MQEGCRAVVGEGDHGGGGGGCIIRRDQERGEARRGGKGDGPVALCLRVYLKTVVISRVDWTSAHVVHTYRNTKKERISHPSPPPKKRKQHMSTHTTLTEEVSRPYNTRPPQVPHEVSDVRQSLQVAPVHLHLYHSHPAPQQQRRVPVAVWGAGLGG